MPPIIITLKHLIYKMTFYWNGLKLILIWSVYSGASFAFSIYDFEGKGKIDAFNLGDLLRALNSNPTLATIEKLGGTKKKGEKLLTVCSNLFF